KKRRAGDGVFPGGSGERRRSGDGEGTEGAILPDGLLDGSPPGHRAGGPSSPPGGRFDPDRLSRAIPGHSRNLGGTGPLLLPKCPGTGGEGHTAGIEGGASLGPAAGYLLSGARSPRRRRGIAAEGGGCGAFSGKAVPGGNRRPAEGGARCVEPGLRPVFPHGGFLSRGAGPGRWESSGALRADASRMIVRK